jgi:hypothetical protein
LEEPNRVVVEARGDEIIVTPLGFYAAPQLILRRRFDTDDHELLAKAWQAANEKACELGWIAQRRPECPLLNIGHAGCPLYLLKWTCSTSGSMLQSANCRHNLIIIQALPEWHPDRLSTPTTQRHLPTSEGRPAPGSARFAADDA